MVVVKLLARNREERRDVGLGESSTNTNAALLVLEILLDLVIEILVRWSAYMDVVLFLSFIASFGAKYARLP